MANTLDFTFNGKDKTQTAFRSLNRSVSKTQKGFDKLKGAMGALAGIASIGALVGFTKNMLEVGDRIGKVAIQIGISSEALQKLQFAGEQSGVSTEALNKSLQKFARTIGEANSGMKLQKEAFQQLGISTKDLNDETRPTVEILMDVVDALDKETDMATKAKLASDLFGRSGVELVPLLEQGSIGIKELGEQLERYGGILDDDAIQHTQEFNDQLNLLGKTSRQAFNPMIRAMNRTLKALMGPDAKQIDVFGIANKSTEELEKRLADITTKLKTIGDEYIKHIKNQEKWNSWTQKGLQAIRKAERLETELVELRSESDAITEKININIDEGIKAEKEKKAVIEKSLELQVYTFTETEKQLKTHLAFTEDIVELDEKDQRIWKAKITDANGVLHVVEGLTKEESDLLVVATKNVKVFEAQAKSLKIAEKITKDIVDEEKDKTQEFEKQKKKNNEVALALFNGIQNASASASRFFKAMNIQLIEVKGKLQATFDTNWVAILVKFAMSSKKVTGIIDKLFSGIGKGIDRIFSFLGDTDSGFSLAKTSLEQINDYAKELNDTQKDYLDTLNYATSDLLELAKIERDYQKNKEEAKRLNSGYLRHLADQNYMLAVMANKITAMRRATDAFKQSVMSYIDALEQEGFTNLQKEMFMTLKGFIRGPLKNYNTLIEKATGVVTKGQPELVTAKSQKAALEKLLAIGNANTQANYDQKIAIIKSDAFLSKLFKDILRPQSEVSAVRRMEIYEALVSGSLAFKELGKLTGDDGIIALLTKSISDASSEITSNTDLLNQASGGLTVMLKDSLKADFDSGKAKKDLVTDITAVANLLKEAGLDIKVFLDYIETLTPGGAGGLFQKYPYGGKIYGPGHTGGGVNANLEGGEFVMSRSAVNRYGSDFMSSVNNGSFGGSDQVEVSVYLDMEGQVKLPLHSYISSVTNKAERSGNPELAGILAG